MTKIFRPNTLHSHLSEACNVIAPLKNLRLELTIQTLHLMNMRIVSQCNAVLHDDINTTQYRTAQ